MERGREFTWGDDLGWLSWRWCWRLFSVALRWRLLRSPMTATVLLLHGVGIPGHSGSLLLSFFLPFLHLPLSVSLSISLVFGFYCFGSFSLNTVSFSLSVSLPVFCRSFLPPPPISLLRSGDIYRGRGSGVDPAPSHRCPCMGCTSPALPRRRQRWPMEALLAGHGCSGISSWDGWRLTSALKHVEGREKGKKTVPPQNGTISSLFFCFFKRMKRRHFA